MTEQKNTLKEKSGVSPGINSSSTDSRRKFLTKVAVGAPLLTTIASRPVWAGQCTLSGNLSNNVSNHDETTSCSMWGYSGGSWCRGHANNNDFWSLIGLTKNSPLSQIDTLIDGANIFQKNSFDPIIDFQVKLQGTLETFDKRIALIGDALGCNDTEVCELEGSCDDSLPNIDDYSFINLGILKQNKKPKTNSKGKWKQRTTAALNLLLWQAMNDAFDGCLPSDFDRVHADFYFNTTMQIIKDADVDTLSYANRTGFPEKFQNVC